jgi:anthranilate synthase component 1
MTFSFFRCAPDFEAFRALSEKHTFVPVMRRLAADTLTPVSAFHRLRTKGHSFLFESVVGGEHVGRYSFLSSDPFLTFSARGHNVLIRDLRSGENRAITSANPLNELRRMVGAQKTAAFDGLPPFVGGAVGYVGYDAIRYCENLPNAPPDDRRLPDVSMAFYDHMVVVDNAQKSILVLALGRVPEGQGGDVSALRSAYDKACAQVDQMIQRLTDDASPLPMVEITKPGPQLLAVPSNMSREQFETAVKECVEFIRAGDIFQVVLSQRLAVPVRAAPLETYRTLRTLNPSPFMFLLDSPEVTLVGSSPEIMCRVADCRITVRPLAGTRARGADAAEDARLAEELLRDPKERAEHVMLVDLGRNDVGRVARFGSVTLTDLMTVERYSHVMHLTSNVSGILADGLDAFDALMACLPAGTVSGAPKVRAMEIIDQLEPHRRGPYAGAIGYFDFRGNMDTCIALRTIVFQNATAYVQAGAGIVADSDPSLEYDETMNKAQALLKAIQMTEDRL